MKKLFTILTVVILTTTISLGQDLTSKKGENYLPEQGEWAIGFDATSLLNYFGNFLNSNATAPTMGNYFNDNAFYGKMMIDDKSAWRARVELGFGSESEVTPNEETIGQDNNGNDIDEFKDDEVTNSNFGLNLWLGKEFRRGSTRLQGVYGAEVGLGFNSSSISYDWGHNPWDHSVEGSGRTTEIDNGSTFTLGARAFIGAEYFILPKMSLSAEYGWGLGLNFGGASSVTTESTTFDSNGDESGTESSTSDGSSSSNFGIGNDLRGTLGIHLYF